ncbi:hypothetical protein M231_00183 [Tremella mesenterica]|uniref:Cytochrome c oxidase assembly factor 3 n=1 Tax=Tremella mesenterica TaxID=5217 RepID=A0A4Q1BWS1_TREME|nr:uncharacterized protein TREMEDRAFT_59087 [Tremella mesenterica DSM 1558]EIW72926.1 hypothetical protein TREMEDRAFT_59087 [Tremella mesenterica DSM 1558]RXK42629.1 hypothetical protein M231_00183 [Tremella mesenterica]
MTGTSNPLNGFDTYHPQGHGTSPGLARARRPFRTANFIVGGGLTLFILGVYSYSISAVKQDDFSDVADLLPPLEERRKIRSIEDEERDKRLGSSLESSPPSTTQTISSSPLSWFPRRLSDLSWVQRRGWVETNTNNVTVWGAPNVDSIGRIGDKGTPRSGVKTV